MTTPLPSPDPYRFIWRLDADNRPFTCSVIATRLISTGVDSRPTRLHIPLFGNSLHSCAPAGVSPCSCVLQKNTLPPTRVFPTPSLIQVMFRPDPLSCAALRSNTPIHQQRHPPLDQPSSFSGPNPPFSPNHQLNQPDTFYTGVNGPHTFPCPSRNPYGPSQSSDPHYPHSNTRSWWRSSAQPPSHTRLRSPTTQP